jgi:hypothetical protein
VEKRRLRLTELGPEVHTAKHFDTEIVVHFPEDLDEWVRDVGFPVQLDLDLVDVRVGYGMEYRMGESARVGFAMEQEAETVLT